MPRVAYNGKRSNAMRMRLDVRRARVRSHDLAWHANRDNLSSSKLACKFRFERAPQVPPIAQINIFGLPSVRYRKPGTRVASVLDVSDLWVSACVRGTLWVQKFIGEVQLTHCPHYRYTLSLLLRVHCANDDAQAPVYHLLNSVVCVTSSPSYRVRPRMVPPSRVASARPPARPTCKALQRVACDRVTPLPHARPHRRTWTRPRRTTTAATATATRKRKSPVSTAWRCAAAAACLAAV
eukprot:IDg14772t1